MWRSVPSRHPAISFEYLQQQDIFGHDLTSAHPWIAIDAAGAQSFGLATQGAWFLGTRDPRLWIWNAQVGRYAKFSEVSPQHHQVGLKAETVGVSAVSLHSRASMPQTFLNSRVPGHAAQLPPLSPPFVTVHAFEWKRPSVCVHVVQDAAGRRSKKDNGDIEYWVEEVNHIFAQAMVATSGRSADYHVPIMNTVRRYSIREDLGNVVSFQQTKGNIFDVLDRYKESASNVNIFWLWGYQSNTADFGVGAEQRRQMIVIQDNLPNPEKQLAVAFARLFGVTRKDVFQDNGLRLQLSEIQTVNASAAKMQGSS